MSVGHPLLHQWFMEVRTFRLWNAYAAAIISLSSNTIVLWLAISERNVNLRLYSRMIIVSCLIDYIYALGSLGSIEDVVVDDGAYIFISRGPLRFLPNKWHFVFAFVHLFIIGCGVYVLPVEYYFRYRLVKRKEPLSNLMLTIIMIWGISGSAISAMVISWAFDSVSNMDGVSLERQQKLEDYSALLKREHWLREDGSLPTFVGADYSNPFFLYGVLNAALNVCICYIAAVVFGFLTCRELRRVRHVLSPRTLQMQRHLTLVLVVKAVVPFCLSTFPVCAVVLAVATHSRIHSLGTLLVTPTSWIAAVSPLSTLFLLGGYRRRLIRHINLIRHRLWVALMLAEKRGESLSRIGDMAPTTSSGLGQQRGLRLMLRRATDVGVSWTDITAQRSSSAC